MKLFDIIEKRRSTRDFTDQPVTDSEKLNLIQYFPKTARLDPSIKVEMRILSGAEFEPLRGKVGYEKMSFEAPAYLVVFSEIKPHYLENAGVLTEDMILKMTAMGLESCWLTVLNVKPVVEAYRDELILDGDIAIASVVAFGQGEQDRRRSLLHIFTPSNLKVTKREGYSAPKIDPDEMVYSGEFGGKIDLTSVEIDDGLRSAMIAATLAPTYLNRQPVRLIYDASEAQVILVGMKDQKTGNHDAALNCGAVMANFAMALEEYRPTKQQWIPGSPDKKYDTPDGAIIIAYLKV
ncbi:MAG: nitroreductase family protein [Eubacterium sp.]|nr:nitroreductase family protein [Eubacterium sp.]